MESSIMSHKKSIPTWKMYENPLYTTTTTSTTTTTQLLELHDHDHDHDPQQQYSFSSSGINTTHDHDQVPKLHILHLPISARKIATSFWDLSFIFKMIQLKEEEEEESDQRRWRRKKAESSLGNSESRELWEERKRREGVERMCEQLVGEICREKEEMRRLKMEMEEERKMMRMSEVFREERVRMKLAEARLRYYQYYNSCHEVQEEDDHDHDQDQVLD